MTQRERILALLMGTLAASVVLWWLVSLVMGSFGTLETQLAEARKEFDEKQLIVRRGERAKSQLAAWQKRSLSSDTSRAQTSYRVWIDGLSTKAGLEARPASQRPTRDLFVTHTFAVTGQIELSRLLQFLHDFQSAGYLHRITSLTLTPPPQLDKRALTVNMTVDVLSLNAAPKDASEPPPPEKLPKQDVAAYAKTILGRNFFFPANKPPRFASVSSQRGYPNKTLSFSVKASDPENGRLTYSLASGLEGAQIDERSGEIRWTPAKLGNDFEMVVRVTDDGVPALSTEERIRISVVAPPVPVVVDPFAKDDPARDASITALVGPPDNLQVWVKVLRGLGDQPRTLHLNRGDQIAVGSFQGIVKEVRDREAVFELKDGRVVTVGSGQPLVPRSNKSG